jgi:hypothetical protein
MHDITPRPPPRRSNPTHGKQDCCHARRKNQFIRPAQESTHPPGCKQDGRDRHITTHDDAAFHVSRTIASDAPRPGTVPRGGTEKQSLPGGLSTEKRKDDIRQSAAHPCTGDQVLQTQALQSEIQHLVGTRQEKRDAGSGHHAKTKHLPVTVKDHSMTGCKQAV